MSMMTDPLDAPEGALEDEQQIDEPETPTGPNGIDLLNEISALRANDKRVARIRTMNPEELSAFVTAGGLAVVGKQDGDEPDFESLALFDNAEQNIGDAKARFKELGEHAIDPDTLARYEKALAVAELYPDGNATREAAAREAAGIARALSSEAAAQRFFNPDVSTTRFDAARDGYVTIQRESFTGREREVSFTTSEEIEAAESLEAEPEFTGRENLADVGGWSTEKILRFREAHPDRFEILKQQEGDLKTAAARGAPGGIVL